MVEDLVQWLSTQLDGDTSRAMEAAEELGPEWYYDDGFVLARRKDDMVVTGSQDFLEAERGRFVADHDPARVLREIDAKRQLLALHRQLEDAQEMLDFCAICDATGKYPEYPCVTLRLLALPYADRPGYREEWRP
ncbi:DUF6221 family protein [Streptomyces ziwulingensis]|uniref:Uncharacterized protein n=1 Tax=Streptomyces ziwulingensis TaxID=1045501 RepID=A0ABP9BSD7_9ACTN